MRGVSGQEVGWMSSRFWVRCGGVAFWILLLSMLTAGGGGSSFVQAQPYMDASLPVEERVEDLLSRMTLSEKIGQMCQYLAPSRMQSYRGQKIGIPEGDSTALTYHEITPEVMRAMVKAGVIGSFLNFYDESALEANELQGLAAQSRLKIPLIMGGDANHGHGMYPGATVFPSLIGLAATWDTDLLEKIGRVTAKEMRVTGFQWDFAPNLSVVRDMRWGRINETLGEDPYMVSRMGVAMVKGLQGKLDNPETDVLACLNHYIAGSQPINGLNHSPADISERTLREIFLPPFVEAIKAGAGSVMISHNEVNGVPCHASHYLLTEILKQELGFKGFTVSDYLDVSRLFTVHRVATSMKEASGLAVNAGLDMHMQGPGFFEPVLELVMEGRVPEPRIDDAVRRILSAKFQLGLFEYRYVDPAKVAKVLAQPAHRELALEAARKSIVLLRNENGCLPLKGDLPAVFVTGPNADAPTILGDWVNVHPEENVITILEGIKAIAPGACRVEYFDSGPWEKIDQKTIEEAAQRASQAGAAVLVLGENPTRVPHPGEKTEGENLSRPDLALPGRQLELVQAVRRTGVPTVVVLVNGGPESIPWIAENIDAVVEAFYPGMMGGQAVAEVLFGKVNPSGKLPYTVPRSMGQMQIVYNRKPSAWGKGRFSEMPGDQSWTPLWEFGYGLSYSSFEYESLKLPDQLGKGESLQVEVLLKNNGPFPGEEVVEVFVRDLFGSVTRPLKELKAFRRVSLQPGESKTVELSVSFDQLSFYGLDMKRIVEAGEFEVQVGPLKRNFSVVE